MQIWQILIGKAHNRQTMTYGDLADLIGFEGSGVLGLFLEPIFRYCRDNDLPPLSILVVIQETGDPSDDVGQGRSLDAERERVFAYDWHGLWPPTPEDFRRIEAD